MGLRVEHKDKLVCDPGKDAYVSGVDQNCYAHCDAGAGADFFRTCTQLNTCKDWLYRCVYQCGARSAGGANSPANGQS